MSKKVEKNMGECAKKFKKLLSFTVIGLFLIFGVLPDLFPIILFGIIYIFFNKNISLERVLKSFGLFDCFEVFSKEYKDVMTENSIKNKSGEKLTLERKIAILQKRKVFTRLIGEIKEVKRPILKKEEIIENFEEENKDFFVSSEEDNKSKIKEDSVINSFTPKKGVVEKVDSEKIEKKSKRTTLFDDKKETFTSSSSSIWDSYDSVMNDFK